ncbi:hypothetical protein SAMN02745166_02290 [Prosthecobacter debontii]|uniref:Uncharacterized protein n=1 Tax=Prosthecobacter debontii TaxID=48467 RepID=A0A1T4Y032_9BACT|nr:hypothetical protein SAMN02745166_02290 [Prosthecobacter debontii]
MSSVGFPGLKGNEHASLSSDLQAALMNDGESIQDPASTTLPMLRPLSTSWWARRRFSAVRGL